MDNNIKAIRQLRAVVEAHIGASLATGIEQGWIIPDHDPNDPRECGYFITETGRARAAAVNKAAAGA